MQMNSATTKNELLLLAEKEDANAQFQLSKIYFSENKIDLMISWLKRSAQNDFLPAIESLAAIYAKGGFIEVDLSESRKWYVLASELGSVDALHQLAELNFINPTSSDCLSEGLRLYWKAANMGSAESLFILFLLYRNNTEYIDFCLQCLASAAALGFTPAIHSLGGYLRNQASSLNLANYLNQSSFQAGYPDQVGCPKFLSEFPSAIFDELNFVIENFKNKMKFPLFDNSELIEPELEIENLNNDINLNICSDFLREDEASFVIYCSAIYQQRARVVHSSSDKGAMDSDVRTNSYMYFSPTRTNGFIRFIERRMSRLVERPMSHGEPLSVLFYTSGQEYKPHFDYFDPTLKVTEDLLKNGGQRSRTVLLYLNSVKDGGETFFPSLDLRVPAKLGTLAYMDNCNDNGKVNPLSLHAGMPVKDDDKWIAVRWYREREFVQ